MSIAVTGVILGDVPTTYHLPGWTPTDVAGRSEIKSVLLDIAGRQLKIRMNRDAKDPDRSRVLQLSIWDALSVIRTARSHARSYTESGKRPVSGPDRLGALFQNMDARSPRLLAKKAEAFITELDALDPSLLGVLADHEISDLYRRHCR